MVVRNTPRCREISPRSGLPCRNTVSYLATPANGETETEKIRKVCGTHANSLHLKGWQLADYIQIREL